MENNQINQYIITKLNYFHIFFLLIIYYFTKKYHESQLKLNWQLEQNKTLVEENKNFIIGITNQIKIPLSVIIGNFTLIQEKSKGQHKKFLQQINSSLRMLRNSYEDMSYLIENKKHIYLPKNLNISNFLEDRVSFFEDIAKTQNKFIYSLMKVKYKFINLNKNP